HALRPDPRSCLPAGARITAKPPRVNMDPLGGFAPEIAGADVDHCGRYAHKHNNHRSRGLVTPSPPRFNTCVWMIVVLTSACPRSSCTVRMSDPLSSRCVANESETYDSRPAWLNRRPVRPA